MNSQRSYIFLCVKWLLFGIVLLEIIGTIASVSIGLIIFNPFAKSNLSYDDKDATSVVIGVLIAAVVINILLDLVGLLGAYKEHFCMTMTYAVKMALVSLGSISMAVKTSSNWFSIIILNLIITGLAFTFARNLHILRNQKFTTPVIVNPAQTQSVIYIAPGYSGHQCQSQSAGWQPLPPVYTSVA